jgi:hypothetical protein
MSGRTKKRDALLEHLLAHRPPGAEDFFAFAIVTDAPEPTWDRRQTIIGTYEKATELCVSALGRMAENGSLRKGARVELYQGERARKYLCEGAVQEACYQDERRAESNN